MIKTKQELLNHFSDINAMYNNPFEYQTLSNMIDELLEQQPSDDCISRKDAIKEFQVYREYNSNRTNDDWVDRIELVLTDLPSVTPKFTDTEIQKMQDLEQSQLDKAYELGKAEMQPCEDCISRKAVLDTEYQIKEINDIEYVMLSEVQMKIRKMPSVTPKAEWISVSERLPEDYIHVLCQFYLGGMGECYLAHGVFHVVGGVVMTCNEVVAWMPLPEPYKEESKTEQALAYADQDTLMPAT